MLLSLQINYLLVSRESNLFPMSLHTYSHLNHLIWSRIKEDMQPHSWGPLSIIKKILPNIINRLCIRCKLFLSLHYLIHPFCLHQFLSKEFFILVKYSFATFLYIVALFQLSWGFFFPH